MLVVEWTGKGTRLDWTFWEWEKRNGNFKREKHQTRCLQCVLVQENQSQGNLLQMLNWNSGRIASKA